MLSVSIGCHSDAGHKEENQDYVAAHVPDGPALQYKGIVAVIADGISTSEHSRQAAQIAVTQFIEDYYATSELLSVHRAASDVLSATNHWLYTAGVGRGCDMDRGWVTTFSAFILRHHTCYWIHCGDTRLYRLRQGGLQQLSRDHQQWQGNQYYLSNALGIQPRLNVDTDSTDIQPQDVFLLLSDGVYDVLSPAQILLVVQSEPSENNAACELVRLALEQGSQDNLTAQVVRVLDTGSEKEAPHDEALLPCLPVMSVGDEVDGFRILCLLHQSARSCVYKAIHHTSGKTVIIKAPSVDMSDDHTHLQQLLNEQWIARRINSRFVQKACEVAGPKTALYSVLEYCEGITLAQWFNDNPTASFAIIRDIVEQVGKGVLALNRRQVIHGDIRPENILINAHRQCVLIDLGNARVGGTSDLFDVIAVRPGAAMYTAPEYFLGYEPDEQADQYSLAVLTYYLCSQRFPYAGDVPKANSLLAQRRLRYRSVISQSTTVPVWLDTTLKKATQCEPHRRYTDIGEYLHFIFHPDPAFSGRFIPIMQRHPVRFWQTISGLLTLCIFLLLAQQFG